MAYYFVDRFGIRPFEDKDVASPKLWVPVTSVEHYSFPLLLQSFFSLCYYLAVNTFFISLMEYYQIISECALQIQLNNAFQRKRSE